MVSVLCNSSFYRSHKLLNAMEQTETFWHLCLQGQNVSLCYLILCFCADSFRSQECKVSWPSLTGTQTIVHQSAH